MQVPALLLFCICLMSATVKAAQWPVWRYDAARSGSTPYGLPEDLQLHWVRHKPQLQPAWRFAPGRREFDKAHGYFQQTEKDYVAPGLDFDVSYQPVAAGGILFVGSSHDDSVSAFDSETGAELWRFYANGPVRFAPLVEDGRLYFVSDDGYLYCLDAEAGDMIWSFDGAPKKQALLGNDRLISMWPARGAPVSDGEKIYFTAGIWPFMGVFVYALDAKTGELVWQNDGLGSLFIDEPHAGAHSFSGLAPQGYLTLAGDDTLLVPNSRSIPAALDRQTGKLEYLRTTSARAMSQDYGGFRVMAAGDHWFHSGIMFELGNGSVVTHLGQRWNRGSEEIMSNGIIYSRSGKTLTAYDPDAGWERTRDRRGRRISVSRRPEKLWSMELEEEKRLFMAAGEQLYLGKKNTVVALTLQKNKEDVSEQSLQLEIDGHPESMIAAHGKLFITVREGSIYCFGAGQGAGNRYEKQDSSPRQRDTGAGLMERAEGILGSLESEKGYAVVLGAGTGELAQALAEASDLNVVVIEESREKANRLRERFAAAGLPARHAEVIEGDIFSIQLPQYMASLITSESPDDIYGMGEEGFPDALYEMLRPYGGVIWLPPDNEAAEMLMTFATSDPPPQGSRFDQNDERIILSREGSLPGADNWTHLHGNPGKTRTSDDERVRAPMGMLWFGGPMNYNWSPGPLVMEGRVFVMGVDYLRATDAYTGRILWEEELPKFPPESNIQHGLLALAQESVYTAREEVCYRFCTETGEVTGEFVLPFENDDEEPVEWGEIFVWEDLLIAAADPIVFHRDDGRRWPGRDTSSRYILGVDRRTGEVQWKHRSDYGFRHDAIAVGGGRVYGVDMTPDFLLHQKGRRGDSRSDVPAIIALDAATGEAVWRTEEHAFASWLSYSEKHDVLLGGIGTGGGQDPPVTMIGLGLPKEEATDYLAAFNGADGTLMWRNRNEYFYPFLVQDDTIIFGRRHDRVSLDLKTGEVEKQMHPLTDHAIPWSYERAYGCNTPVASPHLMSARSGAAGYYDLERDGGTGNFGGFRSGCRNNLVPAGGIINSPDMTARCVCAYALQTSLALVHMPEVEMWTYNYIPDSSYDPFDKRPEDLSVSGPVRRLGVNFGAPGNRRTDDGVLWLEYPQGEHPSPSIDLDASPDDPEWFYRHSLRIEGGEGYPWVVASGAIGLEKINLVLDTDQTAEERLYTVRLFFSEPEEIEKGERVFDVSLQDEIVLSDLDVAREAGGPRHGLVLEFSDVGIVNELSVQFLRAEDGSRAPLICGIEVVEDRRLESVHR